VDGDGCVRPRVYPQYCSGDGEVRSRTKRCANAKLSLGANAFLLAVTDPLPHATKRTGNK
jgi:hypothetical protein